MWMWRGKLKRKRKVAAVMKAIYVIKASPWRDPGTMVRARRVRRVPSEMLVRALVLV
jgi:hypothetical protein